MLSANWVLYCLLVPGAKCGRAAVPSFTNYGDSLQYADQREIWDICETVDSVATPTPPYRPQPSRNREYYDLITVRFLSP